MYLLDTHILLWALFERHKLSDHLLNVLENDNYAMHISVVSLWEIQIKQSIGKMRILSHFAERMEELECKILPITEHDVSSLQNLPLIHKDPFDRMLIAQNIRNKLTLITSNKHIRKYDIQIIVN